MSLSTIHVIVLVLLVSVTFTRPYAPKCSRIVNMPCTIHRDCRCLFSLFLCSRQKTCQKATPEVITDLLPCPGTYKNPCSSDSDCKCETHRLKCEENECVRDRTDTSSRRSKKDAPNREDKTSF